jgi:hypothetical protein
MNYWIDRIAQDEGRLTVAQLFKLAGIKGFTRVVSVHFHTITMNEARSSLDLPPIEEAK